MAYLRKNSSVDDAEYNNFIRDFKSYYLKYIGAIKKIVNKIENTVMIEGCWTDDYATKFAEWFNDVKGEADGSDRLNRAIVKMDELFQKTCFDPVKEVIQLIGTKQLSSTPMLKKASKAKDIYDLLGVKKYGKADFKKLREKRNEGEKVVVVANDVNSLVDVINNNIKEIRQQKESIENLVKRRITNPGYRCIEITGFDGKTVSDIMKTIDDRITKFGNKAFSIISNVDLVDERAQKIMAKFK